MAQVEISIIEARILSNVIRIKAEVTKNGERKPYEFDVSKAEMLALPDKATRIQYAISQLFELRRQLRPPPSPTDPPTMNITGTATVEEPD